MVIATYKGKEEGRYWKYKTIDKTKIKKRLKQISQNIRSTT